MNEIYFSLEFKAPANVVDIPNVFAQVEADIADGTYSGVIYQDDVVVGSFLLVEMETI